MREPDGAPGAGAGSPSAGGAEERVLGSIDAAGLVETLLELIAIRSDRGKESPAQERMARLMADAGMDVDLWPVDLSELRLDPAYHAELRRTEALGVVGRMGGERGAGSRAGRTLVLNGHVDVVPAGERRRWTVPPWKGTVREGRVYGRGAADMKGGLLAGLFAVRALLDAGVTLPGTVLLQSVVGEEDGGLGTLAAVRRGHTGDAAIVMEPTSLVVGPAHAGALNFRITVPGRAAHGALRREGVSPIEKFIPLFRALRKLEARRNARPVHPLFAAYELPYALSVGTVEAGVWASTVPESLTCEGRLGIAPEEDPAEARRELEAAVAEAAHADPWLRRNPPRVEWWGAQFAPAGIPERDPIVTTLSGAYRTATGAAAAVRGMPYGADMHLLVHQGRTPTVLFGPGDVRQAHAPDESVSIEELEAATRILALTALRFCGGTWDPRDPPCDAPLASR